MQQEFHITRANHWMENRGREIPAAEWLALVGDDPELSPDPENGEYAALWADELSGTRSWFDWCDGNIYTANPDRAGLEKLIQIAESLQGRVQTDDGRLVSDATTLS